MTTTVSGVKLMAIDHAWIQRRISYFTSSCGSIEIYDEKILTDFEDN